MTNQSPQKLDRSPLKQWGLVKQNDAERERIAKREVLQYIDTLLLEQGRLAAVFRLVFLLLDKPSLSLEDADVLHSACEKETLASSLAVPSRVGGWLKGELALSLVEERHRVSLLREQLEQCVQLLTQVQALTALSIDSGASFQDAVHLAMTSTLGRAVNDNVLQRLGCPYTRSNGSNSVNTTPRRPTSFGSPQRATPVQSPSQSDFVYKIREEETPIDDANLRKNQSLLHDKGKEIPSSNTLPAASQDALDRMRLRVERKFCPPTLATSSPDFRLSSTMDSETVSTTSPGSLW
jgi:hypothetical protein